MPADFCRLSVDKFLHGLWIKYRRVGIIGSLRFEPTRIQQICFLFENIIFLCFRFHFTDSSLSMTLAEFWPLCLRRLHDMLPHGQFAQWIAPLTVGEEGGVWVVYGKNQFACNMLKSQFAGK
ncbi:chromosomal replication initiation protein [Neisseria gonorrhoeae]|uniref:Chromosomal replication initiation protein n=1 Tax=Neisseria gonorrhoeae TaxID=485 RepID=A0A378W0C8_NEIGO|nr:chromosomal replication initiation protein [Neisseria gonorrhoeae]